MRAGGDPVRRAGHGEDAARQGGGQLHVSHFPARGGCSCPAHLSAARQALWLRRQRNFQERFSGWLMQGAPQQPPNSCQRVQVGSELIQKYLGDGPKLVRELFRVAEESAPSIVFIGACFHPPHFSKRAELAVHSGVALDLLRAGLMPGHRAAPHQGGGCCNLCPHASPPCNKCRRD